MSIPSRIHSRVPICEINNRAAAAGQTKVANVKRSGGSRTAMRISRIGREREENAKGGWATRACGAEGNRYNASNSGAGAFNGTRTRARYTSIRARRNN